MTIQHKAIANAELHEPKDVSTATVGQVYLSDGAGSGTWTDQIKSNDTVIINAVGDLPAPSGGAIQLVDNTNYVFGTDVSIGSDRLILGANNSLTANNINGSKLTYTGTGDMITGIDKSFDIHDIRLDAATATQVFNISETGGGGTKVFTMRTVAVDNCLKYGTFDKLISVDISDSNCLNADDGLTVAGSAWLVFSVTKFALVSTSATFIGIDFGTSVHQNLELVNLVLVAPAGGIGLKGIAASANLAANNLANVVASSFLGGMTTPLSGITTSDIRWEFKGNAGVEDSTKAADTYLSALQLVTIGTQSVFTPIGGTQFLSAVSDRFTVSTAGIITYISEQDACFIVTTTATLDKVAGGSDVLAMRVAKNGTTEAKSQTQTQSADPTAVVSHAILELTKNDTISAEVANNSSTGNLNVVDMNVSVTLSG